MAACDTFGHADYQLKKKRTAVKYLRAPTWALPGSQVSFAFTEFEPSCSFYLYLLLQNAGIAPLI